MPLDFGTNLNTSANTQLWGIGFTITPEVIFLVLIVFFALIIMYYLVRALR